MEIRDILEKLKNGEIDISSALNIIMNSLHHITKRVENKDSDQNIAASGNLLKIYLKSSSCTVIRGEKKDRGRFTGRGFNVLSEDSIELKGSGDAMVSLSDEIDTLLIYSQASSVKINGLNLKRIEIHNSKGSFEGDVSPERVSIENKFGSVSMRIKGLLNKLKIRNYLGSVKAELEHGGFVFEVKNRFGNVEIDKELKGREHTANVTNSFGSVKLGLTCP